MIYSRSKRDAPIVFGMSLYFVMGITILVEWCIKTSKSLVHTDFMILLKGSHPVDILRDPVWCTQLHRIDPCRCAACGQHHPEIVDEQ